MSDGTVIDEAVMGWLQTDATLAALAPGGVYRDVAPQDAGDTGVFVIVGLQAHEDLWEQSGRTALEMPRYLVKAVGRDTDGAGVIAAARQIYARLSHVPLVIAGYHWMDTVRESRVTYTEADGPMYWQHNGGIYRVEADPS